MRVHNDLPLPRHLSRILVIQLGDIGDVVWSTPAISALNKTFPRSEIILLLRHGQASLLAADPAIAHLFETPRRQQPPWAKLREDIRLIRILRRLRIDLSLDFRADERGAYMAYLSGAPLRIAQHYQDLSFPRNRLFTDLLRITDRGEETAKASGQTLRILHHLGIATTVEAPRLWIASAAEEKIRALIATEPILGDHDRQGRPWVTLNPFSRWPYKEWPLERWRRIIVWLWRRYGILTVLVGSPDERVRAEEQISRYLDIPTGNLSGKTTLGELAALLQRSTLHIGVDSGAPHIAAAVGIPTVTLYGPSDWREWAPAGDRHRVVTPVMDCAPCLRKGCNGGGISRCLEELPVERMETVIADALRTLHPSARQPAANH